MVWAVNDLTQADIAAVPDRLDVLQPSFDHLGRGNWPDDVRRVLERWSRTRTAPVP